MKQRLDVLETSLFIFYHLACLLVIWAGISWSAVIACAVMYAVRMFGITAGYHRYFSHRTYKTSRIFQFLLAWLGACAVQRGPLWWAAHHRFHHKFADTTEDRHSPSRQGFWWSHVGWFLSNGHQHTEHDLVPDLTANRELTFIDEYYWLPPISLAILLWTSGTLLKHYAPTMDTNGFQLFVWGFIISTILLYHATFAVNSVCHGIGRRRFDTKDDSRNCYWVALMTFGEGWHNNHHFCPASERQGFYRWEIDVSHYLLVVLSKLGIVWNLQSPPRRVYESARMGKRISLPTPGG